MSRFKMITLLFSWAGLLSVSLCYADDLEIFGGGLVDLKPNVLIIFDNSRSMRDNGKIDDAETVVKNLIQNTNGVRFGLMAFNNTGTNDKEGGYVVQPCQDPTAESKELLKSEVGTIAQQVRDGSPPSPSTPLAESLAEAGRYFAGLDSWWLTNFYAAHAKYTPWYSSVGNHYVSPIQEACQKNSIIIMTDGNSREDANNKLWNTIYLTNPPLKIGDYDGDGKDSKIGSNGESDYLDDVAKFLYDNDLLPGYPTPSIPLYDKQNISVSTIGFQTDAAANALLESTADLTHGNGIYNTAITADDLATTFGEILQNVLETNATFTAPTVPLDPSSQIDAGNRVYMAFFKPQANGQWIGNLKAYKYVNGQILDADNNAVFASDGYIVSNARSLWSATDDGPEVNQGGVGELLVANDVRNIYTYLGDDADLTVDSNEFTSINSLLNTAVLGVATADRDATIDRARNETGTWPLGDIVHSTPAVEIFAEDSNSDGNNDSYVFVGANDGMLHVFNAETGAEEWGFIPPGQLDRLSLLSDKNHDYFVDGSPLIETVNVSDSSKKILIFGERRGGSSYYALDITDPLVPVWKYQITNTKLSSAGGKLGQSWIKPQFKKVRHAGTTKEVFLLAGGYDAVNQDSVTPSANDTVGRAIYTVQADDGTLFGLNFNGENWSAAMTNSILDVTGFDSSSSGYIDKVYAGDLGGKLFALRYLSDSDSWEKFVLLNLPLNYATGGVDITIGRKFMTKPEVTIEPDSECLYIGSGDREHLLDTGATDAFYVVCNKWEKNTETDEFIPVAGLIDPVVSVSIAPEDLPDDTLPEVQHKLVDLTSDHLQLGTTHEKNLLQKSLKTGDGWFLRMENVGEKITSTPRVLNGKIYFATFTPEGSSDSDNPCTSSYDLGKSRLYMLDYKTGIAAYDLNNDGTKTKAERSIDIGTSVAYDPVLTTSGETTTLLTGAGGKLLQVPVETGNSVIRYFWHQVK